MSEIKIDIFSWSDSFNTGLEEVDLQHKHMVEILNRLAQRIALGAEYSEIKDILTQLTDFTLFHFHSEEQIWEKHLPNDPLSNLHKKHHAEFALKLSQIKSNLKQPVTFETVQEIFGFLSRWTILHVVESDKHLAYIVNYLNQGLSIDEAKIAANQEMHLSNAFVIDAILSIYQGLSLNTLELIRETYISRQMQIKLHESEERLHEAMNYARIGHWDLPYQGTQANWSVQMYELFGLSTDASSGPETLCGLMSQEHQDRFMNSMQNSFEHGHEHHVEYLITRPNDGQKRWIECRGKVIKSNDGTPEKISGFIQDITEHKETEQKIEMLAFYDPLTLLPNRRLLLDRLKQVLSSSARSTSSNALLFLDIDHFKTLNDTHGHDYGDMLLKKIAKRLGKNIREGDTLARIGGDEFVIVLEGLSEHALTAATQTETISNKILQVLAKPYRLKDIHYNSSISIGVVLFKDHQTDTTELMKQADIAMYQAKLAGRNTLKFFDPKMQQEFTERAEMESLLRAAVDRQQFELYFQPQYGHHGRPIGAEGLIRWNHPERGLISPAAFISTAEETGLIIPIGLWVLETACKQLKQWQKCASTEHLTISVNVSSMQFSQSEFASQVTQIIQQHAINTKQLKLELTESLLLDNVDRTIIQMEKLGALGIQFSLDDFGTGYSSLQYLKKLPLYQLKIDQSFIRDLMSDMSDQSIVHTIISMANSLGLEVIAEGVETNEQFQYLQNKGCHYFQGYLFGKPMPISELAIYLR